MKYPYVGSVDWAFMRYMDIADGEDPSLVYLRRLILFKTPLCAVYLHWIYTADKDRHPHNHPMNFLSLILHGGYSQFKKRDVWSHHRWFNLMKKDQFHQITELDRVPCLTLMLCGRRTQDWGFMTRAGFVDQTTYRRERNA